MTPAEVDKAFEDIENLIGDLLAVVFGGVTLAEAFGTNDAWRDIEFPEGFDEVRHILEPMSRFSVIRQAFAAAR